MKLLPSLTVRRQKNALTALQPEDQPLGRAIYDALDDGTAAVEGLFDGNPDECRRVARLLMARDAVVQRTFEEESVLREFFNLDG